jgi:hypothetical protein
MLIFGEKALPWFCALPNHVSDRPPSARCFSMRRSKLRDGFQFAFSGLELRWMTSSTKYQEFVTQVSCVNDGKERRFCVTIALRPG